MLGTPLHLRLHALPFQLFRELFLQVLHVALALGALFIQQARHLAVGIRFQETKSQVFHFPLDLPNAQAIGQRGKHMQRLMGQAIGHGQATGRVMSQGLQARGQAQQHHAQVTRKRQQHAAHVFGMQARVCTACGSALHRTGLSLHMDQLGGLHRQLGIGFAKGFANHLARLVEVLTGIHQVAGRLNRLGATNVAQDGHHGISMRQNVFAGVQLRIGQQRLGKSARARQALWQGHQALLCHSDHSVGQRQVRGKAFHGSTRQGNAK